MADTKGGNKKMNFKAAKPDARILILQIVAAAILSFWFKNQWTTICFFLVIDLLVLLFMYTKSLYLYGVRAFFKVRLY